MTTSHPVTELAELADPVFLGDFHLLGCLVVLLIDLKKATTAQTHPSLVQLLPEQGARAAACQSGCGFLPQSVVESDVPQTAVRTPGNETVVCRSGCVRS